MRRKITGLVLLLIITLGSYAQKAVLRGNVSDELSGETIVGASVILDGTTIGAMTDFDGNFEIKNIPPGTYTIKASFISYAPGITEGVSFTQDEEKVLDFKLGEAVVEVEEVKIVARANRESETLLLMDQKEADEIKESIGAQRLSSMGVSDAASATSKIAGVTRNEGSGDVFIRGLGDRYLSTTMNGLPVPSDDVEKKNIDLNLFSIDIIKNVGISKTYTAEKYGDQSSGSVDISSKTAAEKLALDLSTGSNMNVLSGGVWNTFKTSRNMDDLTLGFYRNDLTPETAITDQSWNTAERKLPIDRSLQIGGGTKLKLFNKDLTLFATLAHENESDYQIGIYKKYRSNVLDNSFSDAETFSTKINTTALLNLSYQLKPGTRIIYNSLMIYRINDVLYEQGRNGEGYVFDQDPQENGAFVRDQNLKVTRLYVNQLLGSHQLNEKDRLTWALAYNHVNAGEPLRIRNEVNLMDENTVQFAHVGDFQQRKSSQDIVDYESNGYLKHEKFLLGNDEKSLKLIYGINARYKERDFTSTFIGVRAKGVQVQSVDNLDEALLNQELYQSRELIMRDRKADVYTASLAVYAAYANLGFKMEKLSGSAGLRFEHDEINVDWDVANYVGRKGSVSKSYPNVLPALNLRFDITEKSALRLAAGKTNTLPEFKELAPFEYVSPTGRVTKGNPDLKKSVNYHLDLKYELFPANKELVSVTGFYKQINDPINLAQARGSSGNFIYENTGDRAQVYGLEFETRLQLIKATTTSEPGLGLVLNTTKMWFNQDLLEEFRYNNKETAGLQGAAGLIANVALSYSNNKEREFSATLAGNYSSDKVLALGAPEDYENSATLFNSEIIEKGFASLDLVLSYQLSERISFRLSGKNLLNPEIRQTQEIKPLSGEAFTDVVSSYRKGMAINLGLKINLN
ncbi:TonB-dependent receptor [Roseimarinus sediminis]|uniref:TonB-dependent receptor n=1 Tax=Roseimarinus sediminis TaxID=1610899 RepID=UPI003D1A050B